MIMKLTLKHIAPYLPYGLKIQYNNPSHKTWNTMSLTHMSVDIIPLWKPILRPLSDLNSDNADFLSSDGYMSVCDDEMRYSDVEELIKQHYDVFGLIDNGLAIDINILEQ